MGRNACSLAKRSRNHRSMTWFSSRCSSHLINLIFCEPRSADRGRREENDIAVHKNYQKPLIELSPIFRTRQIPSRGVCVCIYEPRHDAFSLFVETFSHWSKHDMFQGFTLAF